MRLFSIHIYNSIELDGQETVLVLPEDYCRILYQPHRPMESNRSKRAQQNRTKPPETVTFFSETLNVFRSIRDALTFWISVFTFLIPTVVFAAVGLFLIGLTLVIAQFF